MEDEYFEQENIESTAPSKNGNWLLPISMLIAGVMIAVSLIYSIGRNSITQNQKSSAGGFGNESSSAAYGKLSPIGGRDAI